MKFTEIEALCASALELSSTESELNLFEWRVAFEIPLNLPGAEFGISKLCDVGSNFQFGDIDFD